jgi:hypothetical protein
MNIGPRKSDERRKRAIWGLLVIVVCLVGSSNGVLDVAHELALQDRGQVASAVVTDTAIKYRYIAFLAYRLQYRFQIEGRQFWHDGSVLRNVYSLMQKQDRTPSEYWADTTQEDWERGSRSKRIDVLYLPDDPWISRPVAASDLPIGPLVASILQTGLLVLLLVLGVSLLASAFA